MSMGGWELSGTIDPWDLGIVSEEIILVSMKPYVLLDKAVCPFGGFQSISTNEHVAMS